MVKTAVFHFQAFSTKLLSDEAKLILVLGWPLSSWFPSPPPFFCFCFVLIATWFPVPNFCTLVLPPPAFIYFLISLHQFYFFPRARTGVGGRTWWFMYLFFLLLTFMCFFSHMNSIYFVIHVIFLLGVWMGYCTFKSSVRWYWSIHYIVTKCWQLKLWSRPYFVMNVWPHITWPHVCSLFRSNRFCWDFLALVNHYARQVNVLRVCSFFKISPHSLTVAMLVTFACRMWQGLEIGGLVNKAMGSTKLRGSSKTSLA